MTESSRSRATRRVPPLLALVALTLPLASGCAPGETADGAPGEADTPAPAGTPAGETPTPPDAGAAVAEPTDPGPALGPDLRGFELVRPLELGEFTLTDTEGREFSFLTETRGRLTFLFFGFTHCPDICPVQLANLSAALGDLPYSDRREISVVFITTDPERDTPEVLREWLDRFDPEFTGLHGSLEEVNAILASMDLPPAVKQEVPGTDDYTVGHAAQIMALTGDGLLRFAYPGGIRQADWRHDLPRLLEINRTITGGPAGG